MAGQTIEMDPQREVKNMDWQPLLKRCGGTITSLKTATTEDGDQLVFAGTPLGIYSSADAGKTWSETRASASLSWINVITASPNFANDRTLFAGTHDTLYKSRDSGNSWEARLTGSPMLSIAVSPSFAYDSVVMVGTFDDGVLRSDDAGQSWRSSNAGLLDLAIVALELSPDFSHDQTGFTATRNALYRTANGAASWREVELGLDDPTLQCIAISPAFQNDRLVLAGTESDGMVISRSSGRHWMSLPEFEDRGVTAISFASEYPNDPVIVAATDTGLFISRDNGESWQRADIETRRILALASLRSDERDVLIAGQYRHGIARSETLGAVWSPANTGIQACLATGLTISPSFDKDKSLFLIDHEAGLSISNDAGFSWSDWVPDLADVGVIDLAVSPNFGCDGLIFVGAADGLFRSIDGGASWSLVDIPVSIASSLLAVHAFPDIAGAQITVILFLRDGRVLRSFDSGGTWLQSTIPVDDAEACMVSVSPEYTRDLTLFAGTSTRTPGNRKFQVRLWRSSNAGETWSEILSERGSSYTPVAASPRSTEGEECYIGVGRRLIKLGIRNSSETSDQELTTVRCASLPYSESTVITGVTLSPNFAEDSTLFVATDGGVYVSRNRGENLTYWGEGLDPASVIALSLSPAFSKDSCVYALTLGGSLWRRYDRRTPEDRP
jgi:photosystem II stability/assembly factor-like uncharacterized protein